MNTSRGIPRFALTSAALLVLAVPGTAHPQEGMSTRLAAESLPARPVTAAQIVAGQRSAMRPLDGRVLVRYSGTFNVYEMLLREYRHRLERVRCIVVDERQIPRSRGWASYLASLHPEAIERIDLLFSGSMLRIYTLGFIDQSPPGLVRLRSPTYIDRQHIEPLCT